MLDLYVALGSYMFSTIQILFIRLSIPIIVGAFFEEEETGCNVWPGEGLLQELSQSPPVR